MEYPTCQQCNFTQNRIDEMLELLELKERDHAIAEVLQTKVILPNLEIIIEAFYVYLQKHREYKEYFKDGEQFLRMAQSQENYLRTLGVNFQSPDYFENRLRIGVIHSQISLPPRLYECAYAKLRDLIIDNIPDELEKVNLNNIRYFLNKIITLDTALALESYYQISIGNLETSIVELEKNKDILQGRSNKDTLTGAANRATILALINNMLGKFENDGMIFSIVMCDVNDMHVVNEKLGHMAGDLVLKKIVELIRSRIRATDYMGRFGGDEFLIVFPSMDEDKASKMMNDINAVLLKQEMIIRGTKIKHSINFGVTSVKTGDELPDLLTRADKDLLAK